MSVPLLPIAASATLIAAGASLLLERSLVRLLAGVILLGNGVNLLIVTVSGPPGDPPILGRSAPGRMADPLPQAMVLTSIVITMGVTAFLLSMVHRSWQLTGGDEVQDDTEDRRVRLRSQHDEIAEAVRERRRAYRRLVAGQRAELARLNAARHEREHREAREMRRRIDEAGAELDRWVREHGEALPPERIAERRAEARRAEEESRRERHERVRRIREDFARRERELAEHEREVRERLKARRREARERMRAAIRADRARQARAEDPDLEGDD
ncbi:Na(+)/H(+) antiporter subunit C [Streptosporangium sandarakinum]